MEKLKKEFFAPDTEIVAKNLLWKVIKVWNKYWIIYETEAYKHNCDEASHAFWRKTPRNSLMYDTYGFVYVYLIYWIHYCLNFTSDKEKPGAVLIRGIIQSKCIVNSEKWIVENRISGFRKDCRMMTSKWTIDFWKKIDGPGKLTKYFWIDKSFNGLDLENNDKIQVFDVWLKPTKVEATPRIWISKAKDKLWRFVASF